MRKVLYLPILFALACTDAPAPAPEAERSEAERSEAERGAIEERLVLELSPNDDLAGRQRNAIINRAIDQHYDLQAAPEGYFYELLDTGRFNRIREGDFVSVHYTGRFLDGEVFDDSRRRGEPLRFRVGDLIPAWNLALPWVRPGATLRILMPSELAYGTDGLVAPDGDTLVPADTPLEFLLDEIELLEEL